jgi:ABC transport system ATP-binding/permease protein
VKPATPAPAAAKPRKLGYKEQRELDELPARIDALEAEQKALAALLADGSIYGRERERAVAAQQRHAAIEDELLVLLERWEDLTSRAASASAPAGHSGASG